jgi:hypothetical protein
MSQYQLTNRNIENTLNMYLCKEYTLSQYSSLYTNISSLIHETISAQLIYNYCRYWWKEADKNLNRKRVFKLSDADHAHLEKTYVEFHYHTESYGIKNQIAELKLYYNFVDIDKLEEYLVINQNIVPILDAIRENIKTYFHKDDVLVLELFYEIEEPNPPYLRIKIITNIDDPFQALDNFERTWYFEEVDFLRYNIIFDIGYR